MIAPVTLSVIDSAPFWNAIASMASAVAVWAQGHVPSSSGDPVADLTERLRNPRKRALWAVRHPFRAWRNR